MFTMILFLVLAGTCYPSSDVWSSSTNSFYLGNRGKYRGLVNCMACLGIPTSFQPAKAAGWCLPAWKSFWAFWGQ